MGNAPSLTAQDLAFLEAKGALHVPERPLLDEFMRQYFLHVHPMLPLIDEGDFWDTYQQTDATKLIPLLLFQAMVFASCTVSFPLALLVCSRQRQNANLSSVCPIPWSGLSATTVYGLQDRASITGPRYIYI